MKTAVLEKKNDFGSNFFTNVLTKERPHFMLHFHAIIEILYITKGKHRIVCDNNEFFAEEGDMILIRSYSSHELYSADKFCEHYVLQIAPSAIISNTDSNYSSSYLLSLSYSSRNSKCLWKRQECEALGLDATFKKMISEREKQSQFYDLLKNAYSMEIIGTILRDLGNESAMNDVKEDLKRRIYDTILYINRNYNDDISAEECARNVSLSLYYFSRNFKALTGHSFKEYLNIVRIANANCLLISTDLPITEIATKCGFNSTSHFIVTYKNQQNTTPLAFRKKNKQ
jgi:AraC-like DNA-binding protein